MKYRNEIISGYLIDNKSMDDIATELNVSKEYVEKVLKKIKKPKRSKGEIDMMSVLTTIYPMQKILEQYHFNGQYFDFYIPKLRLVIEVDGCQHSQKIDHFHGSGIAGNYEFERGQHMDSKKDKAAAEENIYVIRIGYNQEISESNIRSIINEHQPKIVANLKEFSEKL